LEGERGWYTFDHRPRYTTNYLGLTNRFGILSEAYSYATFEERILAHRRFVDENLRFAFANASRIREAVARAVGSPAPGMRVALRGEPFRGDSVQVLLGDVDRMSHPYTGELVYRRRSVRSPERMPDYGSFRLTEGVGAPAAYAVPAGLGEVIERLEAHGVRMARLDRAATLEVEVFRVDSTRTAEREYQGHRMREVWGGWESDTETLEAGTVVVPVRQPLGRLLVVLLEPRSDDGFAAWNLLDASLEETASYPVVRLQGLPTESCAECESFR
jgi:hypothetical protein